MKTLRDFQFIVRDVRCFAGENRFNVKPLTLLVGENSTGKSTALGCLHALAASARKGFTTLDFDAEPYRMGVFDNIVRRAEPRREKFELGVETGGADGMPNIRLAFKRKNKGAEPVIDEAVLRLEDARVVMKSRSQPPGEPFFDGKIKENKQGYAIDWHDDYPLPRCLDSVARVAASTPEFKEQAGVLHRMQGQDRAGVRAHDFPAWRPIPLDVISSAPIRSRPERTYNPSQDSPTPGGSEIPMTLMNLDERRRQALKSRLVDFGRDSGLFSNIQVVRLGDSPAAPFQLLFCPGDAAFEKAAGSNLVDVGYGISQSLPILVNLLNREAPACFLLQQPEIHLHPRVQAELSTLLAALTRSHAHSFIVETHSDYIIGRVRIEIMAGNIAPDDVSLIYFEAQKDRTTKVHNIGFDRQGNLLDAPQDYRRFFLRESDRLLGFEEDWSAAAVQRDGFPIPAGAGVAP